MYSLPFTWSLKEVINNTDMELGTNLIIAARMCIAS